MTSQDAFETWWKDQQHRLGESHLHQEARAAWEAACTWQREQDAERISHHVTKTGPLRQQLADAIREGT